MKRFVISLCTAVIVAVPAFAQRDLSGVEIKTHPVRDNIYMLEGQGGNIGVSVGDDGILIIDDQFAPLADKIRAAIKKLSGGKLEFLLNTHHHGDHTGGNADFGKETLIVAHENVRKRLSAARSHDPNALPVITFDDSLTLHFNGDTIRMIHAPTGHTDNDSIIYFEKANVVHMGDHFFAGRFPYIDIGSGGDVKSYIKNVENVLQNIPNDVKIIPGHGPLATKADLKEFHAMLVECAGIVEKQIEQGKSADEVKEKGLPSKYDGWGAGFVNGNRWISILYASLSR